MSFTNLALETNWGAGEWPEHVEVSHEGVRGSGRRYIPEHTYHPEIAGTAYHSAIMCSACKYPIDEVTVYCPHCGARLEGVSHGD